MITVEQVKGLLGAAAIAASVGSAAQEKGLNYPVRPLRIIITVAPGAGADLVARTTAQILTDRWGQNVVVDPRPGGGGVIATEALYKSLPDGYTMLQSGDGLVLQTIGKRVSIDVSKEFEPVVSSTAQPYILVVNPNVAATNIKELVALSTAKPLTYAGSAGIGGSVHLGMERLGRLSGMRLRHVAYKGSAPALLAVMSGEIQLVASSVMSATAAIRSGKVRGIASLGPKRAISLPDLPTAVEQGLPAGFRVANRYSLYVRKGTPQPIMDAINRVVSEGIAAPQVAQRLAADGTEPAERLTQKELRADMARIRSQFEQQVKELGITF
jgi:tripartite-type tricarboxylate transporter receptor subunit TctC